MKISPEVYKGIKDDIEVILNIYSLDKGLLTMADMYGFLNIISKNRAFDDSHPIFKNNICKRILPFDGRDYCWYYKDGCNDEHINTALKRILKELQNDPE